VLMFNEDAHQMLSFNQGMEFSQTATLLGVQLLDAGGNPYAGEWSLLSDSGIDYTLLPVPEPGTWALWLAGLGVLAGRDLRRRRDA
jgi:PEP-CTERM motif